MYIMLEVLNMVGGQITVKIPESLLKRMDSLIERGVYANRSELIREAIRTVITYVGDEPGQERLVKVNVKVPNELVQKLHKLVKQGHYANISEAVRDGIRKILEEKNKS